MYTHPRGRANPTRWQARDESAGVGGVRDRSGGVWEASPEALRVQHRRAAGAGRFIHLFIFYFLVVSAVCSLCFAINSGSQPTGALNLRCCVSVVSISPRGPPNARPNRV